MRIVIEADPNDLCTVLDEVACNTVSATTLRKIKNVIREAPEYQLCVGGDIEVAQVIQQDDRQNGGLETEYQEVNDETFWDRQSTEDQVELVKATFESLTPEILKATYNPNSPYEVELLKRELDDAGYKF